MKKRILKFSVWLLGLPIVFILIYVLLAFLFSRIQADQKSFAGEKSNIIYVHSNGVHLDIALSKRDVKSALLNQLHADSTSAFVSFGWGDKGFYLETPEWSDLKASVALRAMFVPSETAMHVTKYQKIKPHWIEVAIDDQQLHLLNEYISHSFTQKGDKLIEIENTGNYGVDDSFYEAEKSYQLIRTCNMWVNNALKEIGVPTCVWCPFDWGVLRFLDS